MVIRAVAFRVNIRVQLPVFRSGGRLRRLSRLLCVSETRGESIEDLSLGRFEVWTSGASVEYAVLVNGGRVAGFEGELELETHVW